MNGNHTNPDERITKLMHEAAAQAAPDHLDLWPGIVESIRPLSRHASWRLSGILTAAAATVIVIVLATIFLVMRGGDGGSLTVAGLQNVTPTISPQPEGTVALVAQQTTPFPTGACTGHITEENAAIYHSIPSDFEVPLSPIPHAQLDTLVMITLQSEFAQTWYHVEFTGRRNDPGLIEASLAPRSPPERPVHER
jgi:hypothetical protein